MHDILDPNAAVNTQYLNHQIADKLCIDYQSDFEEEISDLGDFEQDDKHPCRTSSKNWHRNKSFIIDENDHLSSLVAYTITTPPPELFPG